MKYVGLAALSVEKSLVSTKFQALYLNLKSKSRKEREGIRWHAG